MSTISSIFMSKPSAEGKTKIHPIHLIDHMDYSHSDESRGTEGVKSVQKGEKEGICLFYLLQFAHRQLIKA